MNLLILDNDECLGYFGLLSNMYCTLLGEHFLSEKLLASDKKRADAEKLFINFGVDLLNLGFGRPGLKELFKMIKDLKHNKIINYVIMYTSASRNDGSDEDPYINWVNMLRNIFEKYISDYRPYIKLYDLDHSGRSDENPPRMSKDGATQKSVDVVINRLSLDPKYVDSVIFMDDRPENIYKWDEEKLIRLCVKQYFHLPSYNLIKELCKKYDSKFIRLGLKAPSSIVKKCYDEEVEDMESEKQELGGISQDNDGLNSEQIGGLYKQLFKKKLLKE
jgi:hypothetical protein